MRFSHPGKESFDKIKPAAAGWREVDVIAEWLIQPLVLVLLGGVPFLVEALDGGRFTGLSSARLHVNLLDRSLECSTEHPKLTMSLDLAE